MLGGNFRIASNLSATIFISTWFSNLSHGQPKISSLFCTKPLRALFSFHIIIDYVPDCFFCILYWIVYLQELAFQRLIFVTMLAWENPYGGDGDSQFSLDNSSLQVYISPLFQASLCMSMPFCNAWAAISDEHLFEYCKHSFFK